MESTHDRLRAARIAAGYENAADAASALGVPYSTYAGHENGSRGLKPENLKLYARRYKVSVGWLLTGEGELPKQIKPSATKPTDTTPLAINPPDNVVSLEDYKQIPEYGIEASAGGGALIDEEHIVRQWPFDASYLSNYVGLTHSNVAIVEVRGDSMEPTLRSGDRVLVDLNDKHIAQPGIFIVYDGNGTVIKRVEKVPGQDRVILISDNPLHGRYEIAANDIQVAGRVVWKAGRL